MREMAISFSKFTFCFDTSNRNLCTLSAVWSAFAELGKWDSIRCTGRYEWRRVSEARDRQIRTVCRLSALPTDPTTENPTSINLPFVCRVVKA